MMMKMLELMMGLDCGLLRWLERRLVTPLMIRRHVEDSQWDVGVDGLPACSSKVEGRVWGSDVGGFYRRSRFSRG